MMKVAAVAGHEIEHLTPENLRLNDSGSTDVEKKPREIERKILGELGSKDNNCTPTYLTYLSAKKFFTEYRFYRNEI